MGDSFQVNTAALHEHANAVATAQAAASQAANAGLQVTPGGFDNAYGLICQPFPTAVHPIADAGIHAMQEIARQLAAAQQSLRATADYYDQQEHEATSKLKGLLGTVDGQPIPTPLGPSAVRAPSAVDAGQDVAPIRPPTLPAVGTAGSTQPAPDVVDPSIRGRLDV